MRSFFGLQCNGGRRKTREKKVNTRKITSAIYVTTTALFVSACSMLTLTPWARPTPTPEIMSDCFMSFKVAAWEDLNGDGVWGVSEQPLAGVEFHLQGIFAQQWGPDPDPSNGEGWFSILIWSPGDCIEQEYTLSAIPPESYEPTTPTVVTFSDPSHFKAQFGFQAVSK